MLNNWLFFMELDGGSPYILPMESLVSHGFGSNFFSNLYVPGNLALQEAFNCFSKFAGALLFLFSSSSTSNLSRKISGNQHGSACTSYKSSAQVKHVVSSTHSLAGFQSSRRSKREPAMKISRFTVRQLFNQAERLQSCSVLLAAAMVTPFDNLSSKVLAVPLEKTDVQMHECVDQRPCEVGHHGCGGLSFVDLNWTRHAVEPRTGIEFPMILDQFLDAENASSSDSEVLVGTGSRTMKIIKIRSLKVYAFGFYVHPSSLCKKLGPKYRSVPICELTNHHDFYQDLLREDIDMRVRLVVNCNGLKINTVKDAFEKSLRARLAKTNPDTDYHCLSVFGSFFTKDIPIPVGTMIDFRRTADGHLITEIGGNQIGAVHSKDLCRAFFDMYIGDVPVSEQTKEEIGRNVADIIKRC
ncbi:fatty-acid-binding protein 2 isoform X2 [Carica papaya]|uniref:fatty-acid-binding protein 2 isoform X2 n=1 Tax=Carica papaya TaxID=3649 RepID=UPI000B8CAC95|nr:fatty-acid-binding protein 2 isoform X2 [Carica papaya]